MEKTTSQEQGWARRCVDGGRGRAALHFLLASLPLLFTLLAIVLSFGSEAEVTAHFRQHRAASPALKLAMHLVTDWGNALFYLIYGTILIQGWRRGDKRLVRIGLVYVVVQLLVSFLLVRVLKISLGRPRPGVDGPWTMLTLDPGHHSMPSGHTAEISGATLPLTMWLRSMLLSLGLGCLLALEGFSRIYLGQHHPSDVFFGWLIGSFAGMAIYFYGIRHEQQ